MSLALPGAALVVTGVLFCGCGGSTAARPAAPTVLPGDEISTTAPTTSTFPAPSTSTTSALVCLPSKTLGANASSCFFHWVIWVGWTS